MFKQKLSVIILIILLLAQFSAQTTNATSFNVKLSGTRNFEISDKVSQQQIFFTSKAPLEDIKGSVNSESITGKLNIDPANIEEANGTISIEVKGMETGIKKRNTELYGKNWLEAEAYPKITFDLLGLAGVKVASSDPERGRATAMAIASGTLNLHGKSKIINLDVTITYIRESELTKKRTEGDFMSVSGKFEVDLKDYYIGGTQGFIGTKVADVINIDLELFFAGKPKMTN